MGEARKSVKEARKPAYKEYDGKISDDGATITPYEDKENVLIWFTRRMYRAFNNKFCMCFHDNKIEKITNRAGLYGLAKELGFEKDDVICWVGSATSKPTGGNWLKMMQQNST